MTPIIRQGKDDKAREEAQEEWDRTEAELKKLGKLLNKSTITRDKREKIHEESRKLQVPDPNYEDDIKEHNQVIDSIRVEVDKYRMKQEIARDRVERFGGNPKVESKKK